MEGDGGRDGARWRQGGGERGQGDGDRNMMGHERWREKTSRPTWRARGSPPYSTGFRGERRHQGPRKTPPWPLGRRSKQQKGRGSESGRALTAPQPCPMSSPPAEPHSLDVPPKSVQPHTSFTVLDTRTTPRRGGHTLSH